MPPRSAAGATTTAIANNVFIDSAAAGSGASCDVRGLELDVDRDSRAVTEICERVVDDRPRLAFGGYATFILDRVLDADVWAALIDDLGDRSLFEVEDVAMDFVGGEVRAAVDAAAVTRNCHNRPPLCLQSASSVARGHRGSPRSCLVTPQKPRCPGDRRGRRLERPGGAHAPSEGQAWDRRARCRGRRRRAPRA